MITNYIDNLSKLLQHENVSSVRLVNRDENFDIATLDKPTYGNTTTKKSSLLSPGAKIIYDNVSTPEKEMLLSYGFNEDNKYIDKSEEKELRDLYYEELTKTELGYYMESYVCDNLRCPNCGNKLLKFLRKNMPLVDLICENAMDHLSNNLCYLWQVKTTIESENYFSNYHLTMTKNGYANIMLGIKPDVEHDIKMLQIGFICIHLVREDDHTYHINKSKSFILNPELRILTPDEHYYHVVSQTTDKLEVRWNPMLVKMIFFNVLRYTLPIINTNYVYQEVDKRMSPIFKGAKKLFG
jgi:hypothetical protein